MSKPTKPRMKPTPKKKPRPRHAFGVLDVKDIRIVGTGAVCSGDALP